MGNKNAYFKPVVREGKFYLAFFPAEEGGRRLNVREVNSYLAGYGYGGIGLQELNQAISADKPQEVCVGADTGRIYNEQVLVMVSPDRMMARCTFYPAADQGKKAAEKDIYGALFHEKVMYGIDKELVSALARSHQYCTGYLIARGTQPTAGRDAEVEYFFPTSLSLKPKHLKDGSVDYHSLNIISRVEEGQLLARLTPAVPGQPGKDVYGAKLSAMDVKTQVLSFGNNIRLSEDKTEIYSEVTGHVSLVDGKVFVSSIYEVPADVDNSVGDINYPGNVTVRGNVKSGFTVRSGGDIVVEGVVEGAELYAEGKIIVKRGIHGMGRGLLSAEGDVVIKFIESATVKSGGFVETESIIQSQVSAKTDINVSGGKGMITGSFVRAGNMVSAKVIGSEMGTAATVEVGLEPEKLERHMALQKQAKGIGKKMEELQQVVATYSRKLKAGISLPPDRLAFAKQQVAELKNLQRQLAEVNQELGVLQEEFAESKRARVDVPGVIYAGVTLRISDASLTTKSDRNYCRFFKEDGGVKVVNL